MPYDINKVRKHFTPGNVIYSNYWQSHDRVLKFEEIQGAWMVTVRGCDATGKILPGMDGRERRHCTYPDKLDRIVCSIPQRRLFLDCDGVLADFDSYAGMIFGMHPRAAEKEIGTPEFWSRLQNHDGGFYRNLPVMHDALELYQAVKHLDPVILTGLPLGDWAEPQKREWGAQHFPGVKMICCMSKDKRAHMKPGDVLVDDFLRYKDLWEEAGGVFIHHTSARASLEELRELDMVWPG